MAKFHNLDRTKNLGFEIRSFSRRTHFKTLTFKTTKEETDFFSATFEKFFTAKYLNYKTVQLEHNGDTLLCNVFTDILILLLEYRRHH